MSATAGARPAIKAKIYRNTASYASPTWVALDLVKDANVGLPWDFGDGSTRATRVKLYVPTQADLAINIMMRVDYVDTGYQAIRGASISATALDLLILDGALTDEGARGFRADLIPSLTAQDQSIGNNIYDAFDLKPGVTVNVPVAIVVGTASAITPTSPG